MDFQFYPTPAPTAALMWSKFQRSIGRVCDPSAGQGHLLRHAIEGFKGVPDHGLPWFQDANETARSRFPDSLRRCYGSWIERKGFLAIEIDPRHHASLRELGGKVAGYDFLATESLAEVDQIIMNPPFADGVKHVLHAWKCVYDAEIVAIVNAETIKNPYSQERRALVDLIEKHGSVEFLSNQFIGDGVERETAVEIALIYLEKKPEEAKLDLSAILDGLRKGDAAKGLEIEPEMSQALALPQGFIEGVYRAFKDAVAAARQSALYEAISAQASSRLGVSLAEMQTKGVGSDFRKEMVDVRKSANKSFQERYEDLKQRAWAQIIRSSLLTDKLSNQARRKVEADAKSIYELEFSVANVHGFLAGLLESMGDIYADMVCGLFDTIIGRDSDNVAFYKAWKSNERHRFGMRIKRTRFIIPGFEASYNGRSLRYESQQFLADIDKVFGYLHGESGKYDGLVHAFETGAHLDGGRISTRFFEFRYYRGTQTIHFYPKTEEVIEKLNRFVGARRQWIPSKMEEANADFQKQYEQAEKLARKYDEARKKSAGPKDNWYRNPVFCATKEHRDESDNAFLDNMVKCIDQVHAEMGLQCGPALTSSAPPVKAIAYCQKEALPSEVAEENGQMLLIA